ncbi:MAG: 2OG-Fe(II) oxygenase [Pseudoxanthomonas suwonensis]|nr:2OG-Fe(II) oxygenase [Pseudoxanthomonas suwonensis]
MASADEHLGDFIEVHDNALDAAQCAAIVARMRTAQSVLQPGEVGGGVYPELKRSRDLSLQDRPDWQDVQQQLNLAMLTCLRRYARRWPQLLIAPLMLQKADGKGGTTRLQADDIAAMDDAGLDQLLFACLRPGSINLQWYDADQGGYPYWHCELYPKDAACETLHRHLLWTLYLNDDFEAGETEFLFQQRSIAPRTGSLLLAPAGFTHTHRGNRPRGGDKFIATSWVLFRRAEQLYGSA